MPKFVVSTTGTVRYTCQLVLEAASEVEAEALALTVMPCIEKSTCDDGGDLTNVEVSEVETLEEGEEQPDETYTHFVHAAAKVGSETFSVVQWNCGKPEYRVCITLAPSRQHPDGYVYEKGKFGELQDATDSFQSFVARAVRASQ